MDIIAGPAARELIRKRGLRAEDIDVLVAASGGPKWLVLSGLDRVLFPWLRLAHRSRALHCIGSSIGSWRMACLAQRDPIAAIDRFEEAYIEQRYTAKPSIDEVSAVGAQILDVLLGHHGLGDVIENTAMRTHVLTTRCRGALASENRSVLLAALAIAAGGNAMSRATLGRAMQRVIFHTAGNATPFSELRDLPTRHLAMTRENARDVLMASASIPLVLRGVHIGGAPPGVYRDGGILDYHPHLNFGTAEGLVLYPHFYSHIVPGWFDKGLSRRRVPGANLDRVLMLAPSAEFVASLPFGKIPDRKDFYRMDVTTRIAAWRTVTAASRALGEELGELLESGSGLERVC